MNNNNFISFWEISISQLSMQSQYASRYVNWEIEWYPNLWEWLRFKWEPSDYHDLEIHKDDVKEFVRRVLEFRKSN